MDSRRSLSRIYCGAGMTGRAGMTLLRQGYGGQAPLSLKLSSSLSSTLKATKIKKTTRDKTRGQAGTIIQKFFVSLRSSQNDKRQEKFFLRLIEWQNKKINHQYIEYDSGDVLHKFWQNADCHLYQKENKDNQNQ